MRSSIRMLAGTKKRRFYRKSTIRQGHEDKLRETLVQWNTKKSFPKMLFRFVKSQHLAASKLFSLGFSSGNIFYRSSNPAAEHRRAEITAHGHRCDDIVVIARNDHADGRLPVIRAVGRVESA